jgi:hypothetical protein
MAFHEENDQGQYGVSRRSSVSRREEDQGGSRRARRSGRLRATLASKAFQGDQGVSRGSRRFKVIRRKDMRETPVQPNEVQETQMRPREMQRTLIQRLEMLQALIRQPEMRQTQTLERPAALPLAAEDPGKCEKPPPVVIGLSSADVSQCVVEGLYFDKGMGVMG